ncbi:Ku protein [Streptomyces sp. NPDC056982]|uniref:Ku protein n=1 Tax=Streptomyces sp. NPDC056982 TaxID=3345986 RepID=UPI0036286543
MSWRCSVSCPGRTSTRSCTAGRTTSAPAADRPCALLVEALARTGQVGMCKVAVRSRERIALLRPRHRMLILQTLLWQDELRDPGDLAPLRTGHRGGAGARRGPDARTPRCRGRPAAAEWPAGRLGGAAESVAIRCRCHWRPRRCS